MNRPKASSLEASARMKKVRQSSTDIEKLVRVAVSQLGVQYRLDNRDLPGSPDLANRKSRWAVFVHGCFWHGHRGCRLATVPKSNVAFWTAKLSGNRRRDARKTEALQKQGFRVLVIWGCEARRGGAGLVKKLKRLKRLSRSR
jgi:DNA mismatch endonuclease, patch repair protein